MALQLLSWGAVWSVHPGAGGASSRLALRVKQRAGLRYKVWAVTSQTSGAQKALGVTRHHWHGAHRGGRTVYHGDSHLLRPELKDCRREEGRRDQPEEAQRSTLEGE